jgi:hypothetical protein
MMETPECLVNLVTITGRNKELKSSAPGPHIAAFISARPETSCRRTDSDDNLQSSKK